MDKLQLAIDARQKIERHLQDPEDSYPRNAHAVAREALQAIQVTQDAHGDRPGDRGDGGTEKLPEAPGTAGLKTGEEPAPVSSTSSKVCATCQGFGDIRQGSVVQLGHPDQFKIVECPDCSGKGKATQTDLTQTQLMRILEVALDDILKQFPVGYDCRITELAGGALATLETWKQNPGATAPADSALNEAKRVLGIIARSPNEGPTLASIARMCLNDIGGDVTRPDEKGGK